MSALRRLFRKLIRTTGLPGLILAWLALEAGHWLGPAPQPSVDAPQACADFHSWVCDDETVRRDLTGEVGRDADGEAEAESLLAGIQEDHPDWSEEQQTGELVRAVYTAERIARLQTAFRWTRQTLERFLEKQPLTDLSSDERRFLTASIHSVQLDLPTPENPYREDPGLLTESQVYFEKRPDGLRRIRMGGGYLLSVNSWFNWVATFAHELGHSIDPCELRAANRSFPAYDRLNACLIRSGAVKLHRARAECQEHDQLAEAFSDWLASQAVYEALRASRPELDGAGLRVAIRNSVLDLCDREVPFLETLTGSYPSARSRIQGIYGANPGLRQMMGCAPRPGCSFTSP